MVWQQIVVLVLSVVISYLLAPRPKNLEVKPDTLGEGDIPVAETGTPIPVVFGTVNVSSPNVVWWGDTRADPITKKGGGK